MSDDGVTAPSDSSTDSQSGSAPPEGADENGLTAGGRAAIDKMREETRKARDEARPWKSLGAEFKLTPDQVRDRLKGIQRDAQGNAVDLDQVRRETALEVTSALNVKLARSEVRRLAAENFADPEDALLHLERDKRLAGYEVTDDGDLADPKSVQADLTDLLKRKPHLGKAKAEPEGPPSFDGLSGRLPPAKSSDDIMTRAIRDGAHRIRR